MSRLPLLLAGVSCLLAGPAAADPKPTPPEGVLPVGADGKPLNLDFEAGTLKDWTATGDFANGQPIKGDTVTPRRPGQRSRHQGEFWFGGYEITKHDTAKGTLTSAAFAVTHPWASFLVGGGPRRTTRVEVVRADTGAVVVTATGTELEDLRRVAVDLRPHAGKPIFVRLVDEDADGWGHLNFDDFRFHSDKPKADPAAAPPAPDQLKYAGLAPEAAAAAMTVPEGFEVRLFAGEPDVHQPVAMCLDDRGRLWVAEAYTYPTRHPHPGPVLPAAEKATGDRIVIFEDTDGDGKHDKRTVFIEGLNLVSGLERGFGGVYVGAAPYLLFIPDKDGDDKPDGGPQVLLDGWGYQDTHETLNTFTWGPDGWLYGCHGVFTHSKVGKPGAPDKDRTPINAGVWRYHPTKHVFEVFAHGTSNPWGLDYNEVGEFFVSSCVIPHCFHIVQGGRYNRQAGQHFNPYTYIDIPTIADHRHYLGANPHGGNNRSDSAGGGHAHCGLMCYQGGAWPKEYHGQLFMGNIHGRRINMDTLKPKGSGYVASHGPDFLLANDAYARFINLKCGPDGNVYLIDWYDKQACHHNDPKIWDRTNGRVYKVVYKGTKPVSGVDLAKCSDAELVQYQLHPNEWYVRHARRLLQERAVTKFDGDAKRAAAVQAALEEIALKHPDELRRLRGVWALEATGLLTGVETFAALLNDPSPHTRAWLIRMSVASGNNHPNPFFGTGSGGQTAMTTPTDRRAVASALLNRKPGDPPYFPGWLLNFPADAADHNLPALYWYGLEPVTVLSPTDTLTLVANSKLPALLPLAARRVAAIGTPEAFGVLVKALGEAKTTDHQLAYLRGLHEGLKAKRRADKPAGWDAVYAKLEGSDNAEIRSLALALAITFGDEKAFAEMRKTLGDPAANTASRQAALAALLDARDSKLPGLLQQLVAEPGLRAAAVRGLAAFDDPKTPAVLLMAYPSFTTPEKRDVLNTLAARPAYAQALLDEIAARKVPAADVPAEVIRQLRNLGDAALAAKIEAVWGTVRDTPADRKALIAAWQKKLAAPDPAADAIAGRAVFARTCQQCHTLYGVGGKVGPDITGANRADLGYLLENILDPSGVIPKEYAATKLDLADGRVVTGIIREESKQTLTVATATETLTLPVADVDKRTPSPLSMMPDDITKQLSEPDLRSLIAYLRGTTQVPILATADTARDLFNGKDLTGWVGDPKLWSVENGEIVGKSPGLKRNEFLRSQMAATDFTLTLKVKLTPNAENSGVQFRSEPLPNGEMKGPQADIGKGWWGKLYEESGRGLLWDKSGEAHVKPGEWNDYEVVASGGTIRTRINGQLCVDLTDPAVSRRGVFGLQLHAGGPLEVRFKDIRLDVSGGAK